MSRIRTRTRETADDDLCAFEPPCAVGSLWLPWIGVLVVSSPGVCSNGQEAPFEGIHQRLSWRLSRSALSLQFLAGAFGLDQIMDPLLVQVAVFARLKATRELLD